ncbi:YqhR family membrane protein [Bacillus niameyensis]|uniref:YqhR family membrane protein n=1 Tax=Bacillus niameyensis TaxID=1522308 RepID=UPI000A7497BD|nr:YqhR family membrane protein [Bacillus niameyensis]
MDKEKHGGQYYMSLPKLAMVTGFVAGLFGALLGYAAHYLNFTEVNPSLILDIFRGNWKDGWLGGFIACLLYGLISMGAAVIYLGLLKKKKSIVWGAVYGLLIFALVFLVLYPIFPRLDRIDAYNFTTIITEICCFILYGIFIGFSISYEYNEQQYWKKINSSR